MRIKTYLRNVYYDNRKRKLGRLDVCKLEQGMRRDLHRTYSQKFTVFALLASVRTRFYASIATQYIFRSMDSIRANIATVGASVQCARHDTQEYDVKKEQTRR